MVDGKVDWIDTQGDLWVQHGDGLMHSYETHPFRREYVERKWGPLIISTEATQLREWHPDWDDDEVHAEVRRQHRLGRR